MSILSAPKYRRSLNRLLALAMISSVAACDSTETSSPQLVPTRIAVIAGVDSQSAVVGKSTSNTVSVIVNAQNGGAVDGAVVTWTIVDGNGSVSFAQSASDASGVASTSWTLGTTAGANVLQATLANGESVMINATALAGPAASLTVMSGNNQQVAADGTSAALVVSAADQYGNVIKGLNIVWTTSAGVLSAAATSTDATGQASTELTTDDTDVNYVVTASYGTLSAVFSVTEN
ncbi:MAG: Ig-like domain-containing protein [Gemmatimonas sp.]